MTSNADTLPEVAGLLTGHEDGCVPLADYWPLNGDYWLVTPNLMKHAPR